MVTILSKEKERRLCGAITWRSNDTVNAGSVWLLCTSLQIIKQKFQVMLNWTIILHSSKPYIYSTKKNCILTESLFIWTDNITNTFNWIHYHSYPNYKIIMNLHFWISVTDFRRHT
jgi:hypothetical protein